MGLQASLEWSCRPALRRRRRRLAVAGAVSPRAIKGAKPSSLARATALAELNPIRFTMDMNLHNYRGMTHDSRECSTEYVSELHSFRRRRGAASRRAAGAGRCARRRTALHWYCGCGARRPSSTSPLSSGAKRPAII
eukprot:3792090-Pleurochrysis_carterae.AAC.2